MKNNLTVFFLLSLSVTFAQAKQTPFESWCASNSGYIEYEGGPSCRIGEKVYYKTYEGASDFDSANPTEIKIADPATARKVSSTSKKTRDWQKSDLVYKPCKSAVACSAQAAKMNQYQNHCYAVEKTGNRCADEDFKTASESYRKYSDDAIAFAQKSSKSKKSSTKTTAKKIVKKTTSVKKSKTITSDTTVDVEAGKSIILKRATNARSSIMFFGHENVIKTLPEGTSIYILNQNTLPSGATALKIEITAPENLVSLNKKKPLYIWQSQDEMKAIRHPSSTEASANCNDGTCAKKPAPSAVDDLKKVTAAVEESDSAPVLTTKEKVAPDQSNNDEADIKSTSTTSVSSKKFSSMSKAEKEAAVKRYSNSAQVQKTVAWSSKYGARAKGIRRCYQWVKEALATKTKKGKGPGNNLIPSWFSSMYAKYAAKDLLRYGFVNLLKDPDYKDIVKDPKKIPKGAVLVYTRKGHVAGHAEIKLDEGSFSRYASDYTSTVPRADRPGYTLIGVMIKPNL